MVYAYPYTLCRRAVIATLDLAAENLHMFRTHHWLKDPSNVIVLELSSKAWQTNDDSAPATDRMTTIKQWTVADIVRFIKEADVEGPAKLCHDSCVCGEDLLQITEEALCTEVRLSRFAARKVIAARERFLRST